MKRCIFSIFVGDHSNYYAENQHFKYGAGKIYIDLYDEILSNHKSYASMVNADYLLADDSDDWKMFLENILSKYPRMSIYNIINHYKFHMAEKLVEIYDEVLYLDFDAFFNTKENFFIAHDLKNFCCLFHPMTPAPSWHVSRSTNIGIPKLRLIKSWYTQVALEKINIDPFEVDFGAINTGVMGYSKPTIEQLEYFKIFEKIVPLMIDYEDDCSVDNEVIFACATLTNDVPILQLDRSWNWHPKKKPYTGKICHFTIKENMKGFFEKS